MQGRGINLLKEALKFENILTKESMSEYKMRLEHSELVSGRGNNDVFFIPMSMSYVELKYAA